MEPGAKAEMIAFVMMRDQEQQREAVTLATMGSAGMV